ncbi:PREDICTED: uncharacterized protein LOC104803535 [Tarenaya hassleriana]|uniref:uncharacterized protein LOC104803535 n=1 Tax=Tarenaya hassleriana TaxID=28532 RepID=UPI00053C28E3|nr:PREDICTED: uncharacterized protein LOC104803535 [Tarenaya hassleriana]
MAASSSSFCSSSPQTLHQQSLSSFLPSRSSHLKPSFCISVGEFFPAKPVSISRKSRRRPIAVAAAAGSGSSGDGISSSPAKKLREVLESAGVHQGPCCFYALSAKLVERAGFRFSIASGLSISAVRLGLPDKGLISYGEMVEQGEQITRAVSVPVIGDGGSGYGNAMNLKRTVKGYIKAGFAGIILDDQVYPKASGNKHGRKVVSREEAVIRIKAAVDARQESDSDIVIVAQTDSREAISLDESLWRARAFADAGADVLSIKMLTSREEMKGLCNVYPLIPKLVSMLEVGGKTPILNPLELEEIGFKLVAYPLSLMGVSIQAMQDSLSAIKGGRILPPGSMPSLDEINEILGFDSYHEEERRYAISSSDGASSNVYGIERAEQDDDRDEKTQSYEDPVVEVITPEVYNDYRTDGSRDPFTRIWSRTLRIKITGRDGFEKLDVPNYAGFLEGVTNIVPALGGVNLKQMLDDAADEPGGKILVDFNDSMGDRIQVFLA